MYKHSATGFDRVLERLNYMISMLSHMSTTRRGAQLAWEFFQNYPLYQALLKKYEREHGT